VTGVRYKLAATGGEAAALAHLTVVCDGMYSGLRSKLVAPPTIKHPSFFVGLLLTVRRRPRRALRCFAHPPSICAPTAPLVLPPSPAAGLHPAPPQPRPRRPGRPLAHPLLPHLLHRGALPGGLPGGGAALRGGRPAAGVPAGHGGAAGAAPAAARLRGGGGLGPRALHAEQAAHRGAAAPAGRAAAGGRLQHAPPAHGGRHDGGAVRHRAALRHAAPAALVRRRALHLGRHRRVLRPPQAAVRHHQHPGQRAVQRLLRGGHQRARGDAAGVLRLPQGEPAAAAPGRGACLVVP
jgi:hypothetical protein